MSAGAESDRTLVELLAEVVGLLDMDEFRQGLLEALWQHIPCKWASLNDIGPDSVSAAVHPHLDEEWFERFGALAHENPIYLHWVRTRDGRAYRFRDVCTREALEQTRLYQEVYKPIGIEYQIAITLPQEGDHILAIVLHREERDFTDAERDLLNRARPFLIQAYRNALAYSDTQSRTADAVRAALRAQGLTKREAEVLGLVALGASNRDVAERLEVSDRTVDKHLERAFRKLGVKDRSAAAARAWQLAEPVELLPGGATASWKGAAADAVRPAG